MSRLKKIAKPRPKKKELVMTYKFTFEVFSDNEDEAKQDIKRFKQWMKDQFIHWPESMLQYYQYAYNLHQNHDDSKYLLEGHIDKILKDESVTIDERDSFDDVLVHVEEQSQRDIQRMENELFDDIPDPQLGDKPKTPEMTKEKSE